MKTLTGLNNNILVRDTKMQELLEAEKELIAPNTPAEIYFPLGNFLFFMGHN